MKMSNECKISVIVPIYNTEKYVEECINSIRNQTYKNLEIILINDGSTDNSLQICKEIAKKDNRIILINKENRGVSHARNAGIKRVTGSYVLFVDSDDYIKETYLEELYNETDNGKNDMVISGYTSFSENNTFYEIKDEYSVTYDKIEFMNDFERLKNKNLIHLQCNKLTRASIVKKYKVNEQYISGEDYLFNLDLIKNCKKIKLSSCCGYMYRNNRTGVSCKIRTSYTKHYELENLLSMSKSEREKLLEIGFSKQYVDELLERKIFSSIKKIARNIAFIRTNKSERKNKYKKLLKNVELNRTVKKENVRSKQDIITFCVFKIKSVCLLSLYAFFLKIRSQMKG